MCGTVCISFHLSCLLGRGQIGSLRWTDELLLNSEELRGRVTFYKSQPESLYLIHWVTRSLGVNGTRDLDGKIKSMPK